MKELLANSIYSHLYEIAQLNSHNILLVVLVVMSVIVLDSIFEHTRSQRQASGLSKEISTVQIEGSRALPVRTYISDMQLLSGTPDAVVIENGYAIPVERKPLAKKMHDRYIAQLLIYMRLIEEFEGKRPPHGYLILGPNCRRFKIENTEERQAWVQTLIDEMREVLTGKPARATPHQRKCARCDVRGACAFSLADQLIRPNKKPLIEANS